MKKNRMGTGGLLRTSGPTILLVDNHPGVVRLLAVGFEYLGLTLNPVFYSGEGLWDAFHEDVFPEVDLFLIDIQLPGIDGVEVARRLRGRGETRPIALTSAWAPPERVVLEELDTVYLAKPYHLPKVARELRHLAQAGRQLPAAQSAISA